MKLHELTESAILTKIKSWLADRQNRKILDIWEKKSDESIKIAYKDAVEWLGLEKGVLAKKSNFKLPNSLKTGVQERLDKYILPQMKKRGLK